MVSAGKNVGARRTSLPDWRTGLSASDSQDCRETKLHAVTSRASSMDAQKERGESDRKDWGWW